MRAENASENGAGRGSSLWTDFPRLRRTLAFLLLGPLPGVVAVMISEALYGGMGPYLSIIMAVVFVLGLAVAAITGLADSLLSRVAPVAWRVPLTALIGTTVAIGLTRICLGPIPNPLTFAGVAAFSASLCSLLSHDFRRA